MRHVVQHSSSSEGEEETIPPLSNINSQNDDLPLHQTHFVQSCIKSSKSKKTFLVRSQLVLQQETSELLNQNTMPDNENAPINQSAQAPQTVQRILKKRHNIAKVYDHGKPENINALKKLIAKRSFFKDVKLPREFLQVREVSSKTDQLAFIDGSNQVHQYDSGYTLLVEQMCPNGDLLSYIQNYEEHKEVLESNKKNVGQVFLEIVQGLKFLHQTAKQAHLNLRLSKIFFDAQMNPKIGGLSRFQPIDKIKQSDIRITKLQTEKCFCAPEIHMADTKKPVDLDGEKIDIFSLGVMLFMMLFKELPFYQAVHNDLHYRYFCGTFQQFERFLKLHRALRNFKLSTDLQKLLFSMLNIEASQRPTINELLEQHGEILIKIEQQVKLNL